MIIRIIVLFMLLIGPGSVQGQDQREQQGGTDKEKPQTQQEGTNGQEEARWPLPFNPSREIDADSQVSFPVDI